MTELAIALTPEETELLGEIEFDANRLVGDLPKYRRNAQAVVALTTMLLKRDAIPQNRFRYFMDADCNPGGRGKSRKNIFERNGTQGRAILEHLHFLEYLHYFLYGAALPANALREFRNEVESCGPINSGDLAPLENCAKRLTRAHRLKPSHVAEEFLKLALDCGLTPFFAEHIRSTVKRIR